MRIPDSGRRKALIIVDVQPAFITPRNRHVVKSIEKLLRAINYDAYVNSTFFAQKDSIWKKQLCYEIGRKEETVPAILERLPAGTLHLVKPTKSAFRDDARLSRFLKRKRIQEVHVVGLVTDDCVLATAFDAFDAGFITYVIEECVGSSTKRLHEAAISVLRKQRMTNKSAFGDARSVTSRSAREGSRISSCGSR